MNKLGLYAMHLIFAIGLIYLVLQTEINNKIIQWILIGLGAIIVLYHGYDTYKNRDNAYALINLFHTLIVGPLFIYIGMNGINFGSRALLEILIAGMIFYHGKKIITKSLNK